jgi:hypothetical protein
LNKFFPEKLKINLEFLPASNYNRSKFDRFFDLNKEWRGYYKGSCGKNKNSPSSNRKLQQLAI